MYRNSRKIAYLAVSGIAAILFVVLLSVVANELPFGGQFALAGILFVGSVFMINFVFRRIDQLLYQRAFIRGDTRVLSAFVDRLRFCFTTNDLIRAFREILETTADCTVMMVDMDRHYTVYNSPGILGTDPAVFNEIVRHYDKWRNGVFFFDEKMDLVSDHRQQRGFFVVHENLHVYFFMRFARIMEPEVFQDLGAEFKAFIHRNETIEKMYAIAAVSKEWNMVAETQKSFLPKRMPDVPGLTLAAYFRPLVNVSGDYYDVLPIDEDRTLLLLGDVSGKGLAAALVMGIVVNTVRILEHKTDLVTMIRSIDSAIKGMRLQDKYTVIFIGIVNMKERTITYVNASMADPLIISETRAGRQIRYLTSNCSLIGILDIDEVNVSEAKLFPGDTILMASDGVSEVANAEGEMLGDTEKWVDFILTESEKPVDQFVDGIANLVMSHAEGSHLRDDVTMLAAKVQE